MAQEVVLFFCVAEVQTCTRRALRAPACGIGSDPLSDTAIRDRLAAQLWVPSVQGSIHEFHYWPWRITKSES